MKKNRKINVKPQNFIREEGNWNFRFEGPPIIGKSIAINEIDGNEYVWDHKELIDLIKVHIKADEENINKINSPDINTGKITIPEETFIEKILEHLNRKTFDYREWKKDLCDECGEPNICINKNSHHCGKHTWSKFK